MDEYTFKHKIEEVNIQSWLLFLQDHKNGNIFQSPYWYETHHKRNNTDSVFICAYSDKLLVGVIVAIIFNEGKGIPGKLSARAIIHGGPLVHDQHHEVLPAILRYYNDIIKDKVIYTQLRNLFEFKDLKQVFKAEGYVFEEHLNILVDLTKSKDTLWKELHPKRRNEIRKAYKEGTIFSFDQEEGFLREAYQILIEVYNKVKLPLPQYDHFQQLLQSSTKEIGLQVFYALFDRKIIGCMFLLYFNDTVYNYYSGSYTDSLKKYPNDLLHWEVFIWSKLNGYKIFDFGGAGKPNKPYGVRDYKKKFGGTFESYGRYLKLHKPILYIISKQGFKVWRLMKSRKY